MKNNNFLHSLVHGVVGVVVFGVPLLLQAHPSWGGMTVSAVVLTALHYIENASKA